MSENENTNKTTNIRQDQKVRRNPMGMGGPPGRAMMPGEKAKDFGGTMKKMLKYLGKYKWTVLFVCILAVISTVFMIFGPKILGKATDELFNGLMKHFAGTGEINFTKIGEIILFLVGIYALSAGFSYLQGFYMTNVTMKISYNMRKEINGKIHKLPFKFFDSTTHGEVLSRITNDVDTISHTLNQSVTQIITSVTSLIGTMIMMFSISWQLTLIALCIIPVTLIFVRLIVSKSQKHFIKQQEYLGKVNGHIEEMFGSHIIVKAFSGEKSASGQFSQYNDKLYDSAWKANFLSGLMMPVSMFIGNISYVVICIVGGSFATTGMITLGGIQSFIQYTRSFMQPITQIANISNVLQQTAAAAERVFEFLGEEEEVPEAADPIAVDTIKGEVSFENVRFGYKPETTIINNFSAVIRDGQKIAIVGPTGAGKSTIIKLLMRFYDVNGGEIKIDGNDIRLFKRNELRSLFGMVLQDTWLFNGTIADNIKYGKLDATQEDITEAAKAAQVDHFVHTLPDGYNMIINEEADNISLGQKQLLTIARAILADPKILILDEATSSVDTRTEVLIQKAMDNLMKGRTSFVIAHRLSTVRNADLILVMNNGDIVEQGTHEDLLTANGFYAKLYYSQFEAA